jgi:hypothetical protein
MFAHNEYNSEVFEYPKFDRCGESSQFIGSEYWLEFALKRQSPNIYN